MRNAQGAFSGCIRYRREVRAALRLYTHARKFQPISKL
jgi:head-tail adaptor